MSTTMRLLLNKTFTKENKRGLESLHICEHKNNTTPTTVDLKVFEVVVLVDLKRLNSNTQLSD